ncbi:cache domain-containing protein, partial [Ralstonia pseudosolanacearum]
MLKLLINKPKRLIGLALLLSLTVSAAAMLSLHEMRVDAFERAKDAGANIALVIEHDITRNLEFYSLSLQNVADRLADPEVRRLPDHVQRMVLFDGRIQAQDLGSMLVTDREGRVILDSKVEPARALDFGDRDYFLQQAKNDNLGIYVSKPFEARTGLGLAIALSLRLNDADGRFSGVVSGGLRVRYFDRLFSGVTLGKNGAIALLYADGTLATRRPALTSATAAAKRSEHLALFANTAGGTYLDASVRDGVERLYTYRRIGNYPLFVAVGTATEDIYANWKARAWWIGMLVVLFNVVTLAMAYLFAQHLERRIEEQRRHAELAATDALTGL